MVSNRELKRAHHPAQKAARRAAILDVARHELAKTPYERLTMVQIGHAASVAKGTLYLYFPTKESLFLEVLETLYTEAFSDIRAGLESLASGANEDDVSRVFAATLANQPQLRDLISRMHTVLEHHIDDATARRFKYFLRDAALALGALIEGRIAHLPAGAGAALAMEAHVLTVGWQHAANPAPVIRDVQREPDLQLFQADFSERFQRSFAALLRGWSTP